MTIRAFPIYCCLGLVLCFQITLSAQPRQTGLFLGGGLNYACVTANYANGNAPSRRDPGYQVHLGMAFSDGVAIQLSYAAYGSNDEHSCASFTTAQTFRSKLLLLSLRIGKTFYLRPGLGLGFHDAIFGDYQGEECQGTAINDEGGTAWGLAAGMRQALGKRLSLALEGGYWHSRGEDSTSPRRILAVQLLGNVYF
ncbi:MAG: porin family protein [Calditrichaeota bacterium]|nr:porin family protein [Calditrichota bacterium]MCB0303968.1 porin family protein [Calditrichota bacterium]MCB0314887.1 porin family protein [Calditrichota bacterium]